MDNSTQYGVLMPVKGDNSPLSALALTLKQKINTNRGVK